MNRIQWGRVIAGGLAAGVVLNLGEWLLHEVILRERMEAAAAAMGMETPTSSDIAIFVAMTFVLGLLLVWLYAAIRPRYGPGVKTAVRAAVAVWAFGSATFALAMGSLGLFPARLMTYVALWSLAEVIVAVVIGAALYREDSRPEIS